MRRRLSLALALVVALLSGAVRPALADDGGALFLSREDALRLALANSTDLAADRWLAGRSEAEIGAARGITDPVIYLDGTFTDAETPSTSSLTGNAQRIFTSSVGLRQVLLTGTTYDLSWNSTRTETDFPFSVLDPNWRVKAQATLAQPLLRGAGFDVNEAPRDIAAHLSEAARLQYHSRAATVASQALDGFWDLVLARSIHRVKVRSQTSAEELVRAVEAQVERGLLAEIEVLRARVAASVRRDEVILARKTVRDAEDRLRDLISAEGDEAIWEREIIPVEEFQYPERTADAEGALDEALETRWEIRQLREDRDAKKRALDVAENALLPTVLLTGGVKLDGLAGTEVDKQTSEVADVFNDLLEFFGFPPVSGSVDRSLVGSYPEAVENMDYFTWYAGVQVEIPLFNEVAEAKYVQALFEVNRSEENLRGLRRKVRIEIREAARRVETNRERLGSTALTRRLAEANVAAEREKFERGLSTGQQVTDVEVTLAEARVNELRARAEVEKAWTRFGRATGVLLEEHGIEPPPLPDRDAVDVPYSRW